MVLNDMFFKLSVAMFLNVFAFAGLVTSVVSFTVFGESKLSACLLSQLKPYR